MAPATASFRRRIPVRLDPSPADPHELVTAHWSKLIPTGDRTSGEGHPTHIRLRRRIGQSGTTHASGREPDWADRGVDCRIRLDHGAANPRSGCNTGRWRLHATGRYR